MSYFFRDFYSMNGKTFLRELSRRGIPCSALAAKTNKKLSEIYDLKNKCEVPQRYLDAAKEFGFS